MMPKCILAAVCLAGLLGAQQRGKTVEAYTFDVNGNRIGGTSYTSSKNGSQSKTERIRTVNGRSTPVEEVEEKIIKDNSTGRIVERTIERYGQDGRPGQPEKVRIETRHEAGGRETAITTYYQADINGAYKIRERQSKRSKTQGKVTDSTTEIERPALDNSLKLVERRVAHETVRETGSSSQVTVYSRDSGGRFSPSAQETKETVIDKNRETETVARYDSVNYANKMELSTQSITEIETKPDGSQRKVVSNYRLAAPGRSIAAGRRRPELHEQEITEQRIQRDGSVVEVTGIRRVELSDAGKLGPYQKVSEVVCTGNCLEPAKTPAEKKDSSKSEEKK